ncbi:MAG TPA: amino acid racemase [Anaerovoracaceae bacterium]|nr:amino acid racemase [Anaerovoracaceae bacterium]
MWKKEKVLGIVGGMGPLATQLFYRMLIDMTDAEKDQDHLNMIILNHASMPDRTELIKTGKSDQLFEALLKDARKLENDGVAAIAIPCNTSHMVVDRLQEMIDVPIIHMIRETVKSIKRERPEIKQIGILATDGTIGSGLYQQACVDEDIRPFIPSKEGQALVMKIIYEGIKGNNPVDYNDLIKVKDELAAKGCEAVIMGCTELSCVKEMYDLPSYYVDAMEILAAKSITMCGKALKERETQEGV